MTQDDIENPELKSEIRKVFTRAGFAEVLTHGFKLVIGHKGSEIDLFFVYENLIVICEDTSTSKPNSAKTHLHEKVLFAKEVMNNKQEFLAKIISNFNTNPVIAKLNEFSLESLVFRFLHFTTIGQKFSQNEINLNDPYKQVNPSTLEYLTRLSDAISKSSIYELFRFLDIKRGDIGFPSSVEKDLKVSQVVSWPTSSTGLDSRTKLFTFMITPKDMIESGYVLRKDSWTDTSGAYQRLLEKNKLQSIRKFLVKSNQTFYNNIIVSLPSDTKFSPINRGTENQSERESYRQGVLNIPGGYNQICIIDGQHRVFAHYEGEDENEKSIAKLRIKNSLIATAILFPSDFEDAERLKTESKIFLDINGNAKAVSSDILLHIQAHQDPSCDESIALEVLRKMNESHVFKDKLQFSTLDKNKIRIATIIKYALNRVVSISPPNGQSSLYSLFLEETEISGDLSNNKLKKYISYSATKLNEYFCAVAAVFEGEWKSDQSKIQSVISINGFVLAYYALLQRNGIQSYADYCKLLKKVTIDFDKENFQFTSSQYKKLSKFIIAQIYPT